jgi:hypothetical protein
MNYITTFFNVMLFWAFVKDKMYYIAIFSSIFGVSIIIRKEGKIEEKNKKNRKCK